MKIFAIIPLSPSVLVPSNSGRNVSSIASSELHPSATNLAAASVSRVDIVQEISCFPYSDLTVPATLAMFSASAGVIPHLLVSTFTSLSRGM